ncbi:MAG TPA: MtrAB system histidine kinase MtrB, partial [Actinomycetales bacterium]
MSARPGRSWRSTAGAASAPLLHRWRRSLMLRVVATTMVLGLLVVAGVGTLLYNRIRDGLVQDRLTAARGEATVGKRDAQALLDTVSDEPGLNGLVNDLLPRLASPQPDDSRSVVMLRAPDNDRSAIAAALSSRRFESSVIPQALRERVDSTRRQESQFVRIRDEGSSRSSPGIAIGSPVSASVGGDYELYFVFSLEQEQATLDLVRRTLLTSGALLVLLVGAVAFVVTRQVVAPVRQASLVAQRLAAGRLHERMRARGEDDLARLAASFNAMAVSLQSQIRQLEHLSRVQQRFVSDVSHELRTPLTTVRMAADVLHDARSDFEAAPARSAELLQTQLDRFESLLADLLEISRIDAGGAVLEREPVDLRELVARVVHAAAPLARGGSRIELVAPQDPCLADIDPRRISRVLRNLVVNALEHGNGHPIVVSTAADDDGVAVS